MAIYIAEKGLMVLPKPTCLTLSRTCLPTLLILDDGCLIAVYFLLCIVCDVYYLLGNCMSSVTDGSEHTVNTYTCPYVHSCVYCWVCHIS